MTKKGFIWLSAILFVICAFMVVSIILASIHNQPIVTEWQSWFNIVEKAPEVEESVKALLSFKI